MNKVHGVRLVKIFCYQVNYNSYNWITFINLIFAQIFAQKSNNYGLFKWYHEENGTNGGKTWKVWLDLKIFL